MFSPMPTRKQRYQKVALTLLFFFLSLALITAWNTPAVGYEASIYRSTPLMLWASLITSVIVGIALVVVSIAKNELDRNPLWKIGFLLVFLSYAICLALFIIRGYYMWCMFGDPASHIGWIKEILYGGHTPTSVIYPATHVYLSEIICIAGLDLVLLHKIVPLIFGILCVLFMSVFAKALYSKPAGALLAGTISCCLAFGWYLDLTPNGLANLFLPFALFLMVRYLQYKRWPWTIMLSIVILLYPVFHPVTAIFFGLTFLTFWIPSILPELTKALRGGDNGTFYFSRPDFRLVLPFLILLVWFIVWISSFYVWDFTVKSMYHTICSEGGPSQAMSLANQISYAQGYGYSVIEQAIRRLWGPIILSILSAISLPLLWRDFSHGHRNKCLFSFYGPFGSLVLIIPVLYVFNLAFDPLRFMVYVSMLGTIFVAYLLVRLLATKKRSSELRKLSLPVVFAILVIFGLFLGGLLNLYPSPYNLTLSYQTTQSEVAGMTYFFACRDVDIPVSGITIAPGRFAHAFLTPEERVVQRLPMYLQNEDRNAPWHFGYNIYSSISWVYREETDLIIKQEDRVMYVDYLPNMASLRYTNRDFERLNEDPGVNSLYSNGGFNHWKVIEAL